MKHLLLTTIAAVVLVGCASVYPNQPTIAFPGAEGYGHFAKGGMALKGHPTVGLISSMKPYLEEYSNIVRPNLDVDDSETTERSNANRPT